MMGVMMPETCVDKSLIINIRLVASCWSLSLFTLEFQWFISYQHIKSNKKISCSSHIVILHLMFIGPYIIVIVEIFLVLISVRG